MLMKLACSSISMLFAVVLLSAGCASTPTASSTSAATSAPNCHQIEADIAKAESDKRAALRKEQNAWKAVVPFVVAAQYVSGKSAANSAGNQLDKLQAEFKLQGCTRHGL
jgi:ABC-type transporter MlaC component